MNRSKIDLTSKKDNHENVTTVLIADDHVILGDGLASLLDAEPDLRVVARATSRAEAVQLAAALRPDVAIVDLLMPGGGVRALREIQTRCPATKLLVLTVLNDIQHLYTALSSGASGYLVKSVAAKELITAVRDVRDGKTHVGITEAVRLRLNEFAGNDPPATTQLSTREAQVLRLLAHGYTQKEVGQRLNVSQKTVDTYRFRLYEKLHLNGRADLVRFAIASGLLGEPIETWGTNDTQGPTEQ